MRATVKYGRAIQQAVIMFNRLSDLKEVFDFEVSVDETDSPTSPLEHFFIVNELTRRGVKFTSLAPRFIVALKRVWITSATWKRWMWNFQNTPQ